MKHTLIVMLKEPRAGRVKTRLGRDIGIVAATWWFRHQARRLLRRIDDPRWDVVLAVAPDHAGMISPVWPARFRRVAQGRGDLGARMGRALRGAPTGPVCVIGGDIPDITAARVAQAFAALGSHDAVFGPAPDGGFWLVGLRRMRAVPPSLFANVRWSSPHALADTVATLPEHRIAYVATLQDVDTAADLK
ncbi:TIGR04282 family arsenosugar biosynthesis glycosyltransferase [uncultured Sulfitobacter sp.]|uniref:TIGR04282 family arsenosugar biosynthesis glycosyltransferase n=1 Tax=uncultured Sulfitobacter sp. TaxID=191468 RepID=UPI00260941AD|nr:TIGR04282 family arsenosugar biosynthesis glycosyltransferase [uncultured Sulfitobacter sp.]